MKPNPKRPKATKKPKKKSGKYSQDREAERKPMEPLRDMRQETFAQLVATSAPPISDMEAYRKAYGSSPKTAESNAHLLRGYAGVSERIKELVAATATERVLSKAERREFLARVVRVDMRTFDSAIDGDLIQEITETSTAAGFTRKIKLPGKRECIMDDAKLAGDLVEKVEHSGEVTHVVLTEERRAQLVEKKRLAIERAKWALEA